MGQAMRIYDLDSGNNIDTLISPDQIIAKVLKTIIAAVLMEFHGLQMVQELRKPLEPTTRGFTFGLLI